MSREATCLTTAALSHEVQLLSSTIGSQPNAPLRRGVDEYKELEGGKRKSQRSGGRASSWQTGLCITEGCLEASLVSKDKKGLAPEKGGQRRSTGYSGQAPRERKAQVGWSAEPAGPKCWRVWEVKVEAMGSMEGL